MSQFRQYIEHGWALCRINPGSKGPRASGWNQRENAIPLGSAESLVGAGLMHAYSGTCALDVDDLVKAIDFLQEHAIDVKALLRAPDAVQISSGRANRAKLLYALSDPLPSKTWGSFELRCGTAGGRTAQDVLPPTIHSDTQKPYQWVGNWRQLPTLPAELKAFWIASLAFTEPLVKSTSTELGEIRDLLSRRDPNCGYDEWIKIGMAIHHESGGSDEGLALWDDFSSPGESYPGTISLRSHWVSFGRSVSPVTADSLRKTDIASIGEFDDLTAAAPQEGDWLSAALVEKAPQESSAHEFFPLRACFDRPEPSWIIPGVLPEAGVGCFWGKPGGGKTFLAVDIALSVALGHPWRGSPVKQGAVAYIAAEDDSGVIMRLKAGLMAQGAPDAPISLMPSSPTLTNVKVGEEILKKAAKLKPLSLVFIDTLASVTAGADENTGKDMGLLIDLCKKIHKVTGALVILVHHSGKDEGKGPRGWSGLNGAFDVEWKVSCDDGDFREMTVTKMKNSETGKQYGFQLLPVGNSCVVEWL